MVYDGRGSQANIVYLAHLHDQAHQELGYEPLDPHDYEDDTLWVGFYPGQSRTFHTRANAERKARLWRAHGCEVRIDASEPIVWKIGADQ